MRENDPTITAKILREAGKRRDKRLRVAFSDDEYATLLNMAYQEDVSMADIIRKKVFKDV